MKLINKTRNSVVSDEISIAESLHSRMRGLMLSHKKDLVLVSPREGIKESSIHMFLMLYSLDVVWLNSSKKVVDLKRNIPPLNPLKPGTWKIHKPKKKAKYVVELGKSVNAYIEIGEKLEFS